MMESTIELRAPFLSPKVVKHALALPYGLRDGEKKALKQSFGYLLPQEIIDRDKHPLKTDKIRTEPMCQRKTNQSIWSKLYG